MAQPIYKVFLARRTEAWYQLSQEEQKSLWAKVDEALEKVGGKRLLICNSTWSAEQWTGFGIEQFPDIEALQKYTEALEKLNLFRYSKAMTALGTKMKPPFLTSAPQ